MAAAPPLSTASCRGPRGRRPCCSMDTTMSSPPATWRAGSGRASSASRSCRPTFSRGARGLLTVNLVADNGQPASVHSGNYGNIVPNPVLPLARLIADIEERVRAWSAEHEAFRREAREVFAKWEDKAVWTPFLRPTVNINSFMSDGASLTLRRTIIPRTAHARLDVRLTPDTPLAAMRDIVQRAVADHQSRTPGITFSVEADGQPASYTRPRARSSAGFYACWKS